MSKAIATVCVGALSAAMSLNLPAPYGAYVAAALACAAYVVNHDALFGVPKS